MQRRCPWCGKRVQTRGLKNLKMQRKKMPVSFIFLTCEHCNRYYGQNYFQRSVAIFILLIFALIGLTFIFGMYVAIGSLAVALCGRIWFMNLPLERMQKDERIVVDEDLKIYYGISKTPLKKDYIYTAIPDFDVYSEFKRISPIRVLWSDRKTGNFSCMILYEHPENARYFEGECVIYDDQNNTFSISLK